MTTEIKQILTASVVAVGTIGLVLAFSGAVPAFAVSFDASKLALSAADWEAYKNNPDATAQEKAGQIAGASCNVIEAYAYLQARTEGNGWKVTPNFDGRKNAGLDPEFACRLMRFFKAACPEGRIFSAVRDRDDTIRACGNVNGAPGCNGYSRSCHNFGLGVDVSGCKRFFSEKGQKTIKAYGLHFPYDSDNHIQCIEHTSPRCTEKTPSCSGLPGQALGDAGDIGSNVYSDGDASEPTSEEWQKIIEELGGQLIDGIGGGSTGGGSTGGGSSSGDDLSSIILDDGSSGTGTTGGTGVLDYSYDDTGSADTGSGSVFDTITDTATSAWDGITNLFNPKDPATVTPSGTSDAPSQGGTVNTASDNPLGSRQTPTANSVNVTATLDESGDEPTVILLTFDAATGQEHVLTEMTLEEFKIYTSTHSGITQQFHTAVDTRGRQTITIDPYYSSLNTYQSTGDIDERIQSLYATRSSVVVPVSPSNGSVSSWMRGFANAVTPSLSPLNPIGPTMYLTKLMGSYVNSWLSNLKP